MAGNPLLGTGFESFWLGPRLEKMWSIYWWHPNEAHNGYIEVFLDLGWLGVTLFALVLLSGYRNVVAAMRRKEGASRLLLVYFIAALVYNLTESGIRELNPIWFVLLLAITHVPELQLQEEYSPVDLDEADDLMESGTEVHRVVRPERVRGQFETV
jgi:O-antigen ligase